ncbi:1-acyl-sn-glycerol-3-phosphate acyltransferase [Tamilnaduibacter salinus]|uniref:1-acyl-sn-glycerol-3-phosphate acyltransferase n=1 Tax=Tamilnaduibacter salinus TaxID=1484056 RepID=A0A2A2I5L1_9GAMM|nr:1-acyl-sn-glycerol-3-phosphate acyltransferase [Tamilnaduibacter salinus]PAV26410.1 glycerol acyltransferase [Tamilnaduibacter salinus]PVY78151.1 1-acyl-sn-glycerol-3-phosphate acyltransferase [Tamilnaduibacter salinus]
MQAFDAIRPYRDDEVAAVTRRLLDDPGFLDTVTQLRFPMLSGVLAPLGRRMVRWWLQHRFGMPDSIRALQIKLYPWVEQLVSHTTTELTCSGLENLPDAPCLFLSNHRDIVFDPLLVNCLLHRHGHDTARIAIGDNLLENRQFAELMRLNKSFVVQRNLSSPREMRNAFQTLSAFIHHSIEQDRQSIWIAQREGRAKDGRDGTDPAIIKMLYMSQKRGGPAFAEAMRALRIVPVSIAYEWDPCDQAKARELARRAEDQDYCKSADEDTAQILQGLRGPKGRVHVHFGAPIQEPGDDPKTLAQQVDHEIHRYYRLHPSNLAAWLMTDEAQAQEAPLGQLEKGGFRLPDQNEIEAASAAFSRHLHTSAPSLAPYLLDMYANPVRSALESLQSNSEE